MFSRFSMAEIGKNLYIAYTDDIKYVIYESFSPVTNITRTLIILDFVKFKFRVYKKKCPISAVKTKITKYFLLTYKFYGRSYIAYTDDIKYVIYAFFSTDTINTSTPIILDFVKVKFRDYKFFFPISTVYKFKFIIFVSRKKIDNI